MPCSAQEDLHPAPATEQNDAAGDKANERGSGGGAAMDAASSAEGNSAKTPANITKHASSAASSARTATAPGSKAATTTVQKQTKPASVSNFKRFFGFGASGRPAFNAAGIGAPEKKDAVSSQSDPAGRSGTEMSDASKQKLSSNVPLTAPRLPALKLTDDPLSFGADYVPDSSAPSRENIRALKLIRLEPSQFEIKSVGDLIITLRRRVTDHAQDPNLRLRLATYLLIAGDYEGACLELKRAIALNPSDFVSHAILAKILNDIGDQQSSTQEFNRAIELKNDAMTHLIYADCLTARGNVSEGINEYRRAIAIQPIADAYSGLAEALLMVRDTIGAVKAARQAVSAEPSSSRAHVALTKALLQSSNAHSAYRTARQATLLNPTSAESHIAHGRALFAKGDVPGAVDAFKQAVSLDPLNAQARNDLGYALYSKGDMYLAVHEFRLALRINPRFAEARNNLEIAIHGVAGRKRP